MLTGSAAASSTRMTAAVSRSSSPAGNFGFISCKSSSKESVPCFGARRPCASFFRRVTSLRHQAGSPANFRERPLLRDEPPFRGSGRIATSALFGHARGDWLIVYLRGGAKAMWLRVVLRIVAVGIAVALAGVSSAVAEESYPAEIVPQMGHAGEVYSVAVSPDGRFALSGGCNTIDPDGQCIEDSTKLWEVATGKELRSFSGQATSVVFTPDGRFALARGGKTLLLWDVATGKELRTFTGHQSLVHSIAVSPDGRFALSGAGVLISGSGELKLWELATGKELRSFKAYAWPVNSVAFSPDGRLALSGSCDEYSGKSQAALGAL